MAEFKFSDSNRRTNNDFSFGDNVGKKKTVTNFIDPSRIKNKGSNVTTHSGSGSGKKLVIAICNVIVTVAVAVSAIYGLRLSKWNKKYKGTAIYEFSERQYRATSLAYIGSYYSKDNLDFVMSTPVDEKDQVDDFWNSLIFFANGLYSEERDNFTYVANTIDDSLISFSKIKKIKSNSLLMTYSNNGTAFFVDEVTNDETNNLKLNFSRSFTIGNSENNEVYQNYNTKKNVFVMSYTFYTIVNYNDNFLDFNLSISCQFVQI